MNKNKYISILIIIITMFGFSNSVDAAQELTCLYKKEKDTDKQVILIQDSKGNHKIYTNNDGANITNTNGKKWEESTDKTILFHFNDINTDGKYISEVSRLNTTSNNATNDAILDSCPKSLDNTISYWTFFGTDEGKYKLKTKYDEVINITQYTSEVTSGKTTGKKCKNKGEAHDYWKEWDKNTYTASCLYVMDVSEGGTNGCHIIQVTIAKNGSFDLQQEEPITFTTVWTLMGSEMQLPVAIDPIEAKEESLNLDSINADFQGYCPQAIYVDRQKFYQYMQVYNNAQVLTGIHTTISTKQKDGGVRYNIFDVDGNNTQTDKEQSLDVILDLQFEEIKIENCEDLFGENSELIDILKSLIVIIKIGIPIGLIALGIIDFVQAIFADSEDKMKKAQKKFIKRLIIGIAIFLVPSLLKIILTIASNIWENISADLCGLI